MKKGENEEHNPELEARQPSASQTQEAVKVK